MIERFSGKDNRGRLVQALRQQQLVETSAVAEVIADQVELKQFETGEALLTQDAEDDEMFFILSGRVSVLVSGREVAVRTSGQHVGEMALIDPSARRCATVTAIEQTVVAKISEPAFSELAGKNPQLWRLLSVELCERLRQRNRMVIASNPRPVIFIVSSRESLHIAREVQSGLRYDDVIVRVWTDRVFGASHFPIDDLQHQVTTSDFAVVVLGPDDKVVSRNTESDAPRDNVILELGLFMGALSRKRTFIVRPRGMDLKIPTDLLGLTPIDYVSGCPEDLSARIAPVCDDLRRIAASLKVK